MAGTPEKILEHLLEFMRLDATLYDPVGRWGCPPCVPPCVGVSPCAGDRPRATQRGQTGEWHRAGLLIPGVQPQIPLVPPWDR